VIAHDIRLVRGDDFSLAIRWKDGDDQEVPIASARLMVRRRHDAAAALLELGPGYGLTISGGRVDIVISSAQSQALRSGYWDLEATSAAGQVKTLVGGKLTVAPDVTR
jgi:hypothetical protein